MVAMNDSNTIEWATLESGRLLVATASRAWVEDHDDDVPGVMTGAGTLETTRKLLDGAVGAAFADRRDVPGLTPTRWAWRLAGMYHLTHHTPALMREAAGRFGAQGREALAAWAEQKAREEGGHDRLALRDLEDLGYDASRVVRTLVPPVAARLVELFTTTATATDPIGCVGYAYALERLATTVHADDVARVDAMLPPGMRATRCLRMHSLLGGDPHHVDETVAMVAGLSGRERTAVAQTCHRAARLCFAEPAEGYAPDAEIAAALRGLVRARTA
jgi:hypothetical protein